MGILDRFRRATGEISVLRDMYAPLAAGSYLSTYSLNSQRVTYELARGLYRNTVDDYKLGAWAARPVVNMAAGFMGAPRFITQTHDDAVQAVLDEGINTWDHHFLKMNRNASRDGDCFVRLLVKRNRFDLNDADIEPQIIPPEWVVPIHDPVTGELAEVIITWPIKDVRHDPNGHRTEEREYSVVERITATERTLEVDGNAPAEVIDRYAQRTEQERRDHAWGFVPVVHIQNDPEDTHIFGMSDLEPIEPFMKAYHDVFLASLQGQKNIARPKIQFAVSDVKSFIQRNFSAEEIKDERLRFHDKEVFITQDNDTVEFIVADTGLAGTTSLLEFLYYCIVDVSQTPEFAFGTAVASSKASVSEQMPILARNIRRKRGERSDPYKEVGEMYTAMHAQVMSFARPETFRCDIEWEELTPKDDGESASTISTLIDSMVAGVEANLVSVEAAIEFLREFVPTMLPASTEGTDADERQRIASGKLFLERLEAGVDPEQLPQGPPGLRPVPAEA